MVFTHRDTIAETGMMANYSEDDQITYVPLLQHQKKVTL